VSAESFCLTSVIAERATAAAGVATDSTVSGTFFCLCFQSGSPLRLCRPTSGRYFRRLTSGATSAQLQALELAPTLAALNHSRFRAQTRHLDKGCWCWLYRSLPLVQLGTEASWGIEAQSGFSDTRGHSRFQQTLCGFCGGFRCQFSFFASALTAVGALCDFRRFRCFPALSAFR